MNYKKINIILEEIHSTDLNQFTYKDTTLILIHHLLPTHTDFFNFLGTLFQKIRFIPIPYSLNFDARKELDTSLSNIHIEVPESVTDITRVFENTIKQEIITEKKKVAIIEVGGYSVQTLIRYKKEFKSKVKCVIEDTENGHRLHEKALNEGKMWWRFYSVARSQLKLPEDTLTGDAVLYSLEKIIRASLNVLIAKNVLVLGFGKIGKGICQSLKNRKNIVYVYDSNPIKLIEAYSSGYQIRTKKELLQTSDIIIGATGTQSLTKNDFTDLKDGVILCSASSKKIEFDIDFLEKIKYTKEDILPNLKMYTLKNNNQIFLVNEGAPVNFIDMGIIGSVLQLVWIEIIYCLYESSVEKKSKIIIHELDAAKQISIAKRWLSHYSLTEDYTF